MTINQDDILTKLNSGQNPTDEVIDSLLEKGASSGTIGLKSLETASVAVAGIAGVASAVVDGVAAVAPVALPKGIDISFLISDTPKSDTQEENSHV